MLKQGVNTALPTLLQLSGPPGSCLMQRRTSPAREVSARACGLARVATVSGKCGKISGNWKGKMGINSASSSTEPGKCRNCEGKRKDAMRNFGGISSSEEEELIFSI